MTMGEKIYSLRTSQGMTLEELGNKVGVGKSTVRKWETGIIANMRRDKIAKLAAALGVSPGYLMGWTEDPEDHGEPAPTLQPYYFDPETAAIAQEIHDNRQMQILFDAARDATPEQLRAVQALIRGFKNDAEGGRDDGNQGGWTE